MAKKLVKKKPVHPAVASLDQRVKTDPALLARVLKDPGLRSKLPDKYLSSGQREGRRLNMPVIPGSGVTNRQAESQAQTQVDLQFGPNALGKEEQRGRDQLGWYQQYQNDLRTHAQNVGGINAQANVANQALSQGIRALADQALAQQKAGDAAQAKVTGATPADNTKTASDASAVRQALVGALGTQQAGTGASRQSYADTLANVVAPGQRLQAGAVGQQRVRDLTAKQGVVKADALGKIVAGESKNLTDAENQKLAFAIATGHDATSLANAKLGAATTAAGRAQAAEDKRQQRAVTMRGQDLTHGDRVAGRNKPPKVKPAKSGLLTPLQQNGIRGTIDKVVGQLTSGAGGYARAATGTIKTPDGKVIPNTNSAIIKSLIAGGISREQAHVIVSLYRNNGKLGPDGVKAAHALGLKVNGHYPTLKGSKK